ncbi:DNA-binding transcriptional LysR family regulator [Paraburkholderia silvatlantica]|nr:DNA-binding transcriptional LysR family regulator [Paraburkholderia silvatlantica]PXW34993.1 DNA-binding transcriptional LysR family regulator [Paraburkholderia silvatlantica]TDQ98900.1 DNA-binding transcriptional LysR family regulator [Paraburkholderia silvatlantica]
MLAAGKALGLSTSTTARRLDALEAAIGCQLVFRSRSGTELKPQALQMVRLAEGLAHGLDALRRDQNIIAGTLRISVPDGMAQGLARALFRLRDAFPQVDLELVGESRLADVAAREADIAVRLTRSTSNVLVEKHLSSLRFALFASSDYVRRFLPTRQLGKDACVHTFVGLDERWKGLPHEQWVRELGATRFAFRSSSMEAIAEAVRQGAGLAAFLEKDPRTEDLIRVETKITGPTQPFYLVYHRDLRKQPHVRAAIIAIETYMRANR